MNTVKRIHFYATERDQALIEQIQQINPHWTNVNFILREALHTLLKTLQQPSISSPTQPYSSTSQPRSLKDR